MTKRKSITDATIEDAIPSKPRNPKITLESDPTISMDHAKISGLLFQKKTWRSVPLNSILTELNREIANYFSDHNAQTIKKRYNLCRRVLMETFTPEDVFSPSRSN